MSHLSIDVEVDDKSLERTLQKLERKLKDGAEKGLEDTLGYGKRVASQHVRENRNPFTEPHLYSSFETHYFALGNEYQGFITNPVEHAAYVDQGVSGTQTQRDTPFAYTDSKPPVEKLIPWVREYLDDWDIETDPPFGTGGADSGNDDSGPDPPPIADEITTLDDGYSSDEAFYGANVVVYDDIRNEYFSGSVTDYDDESVTIEFPNGDTAEYEYDDDFLNTFTHGERFQGLPQDQQVSALEDELMQKEWNLDNYDMPDIMEGFLHWAENTNDVSLPKRATNRLTKIGEKGGVAGSTSPVPGKLYMMFNDEGKADHITFKHEFFHAIQIAQDYVSTHYPDSIAPDYDYDSEGNDLSGDLEDAGLYMIRAIAPDNRGDYVDVDEQAGEYEFTNPAEEFVGEGSIYESVEKELELIGIEPGEFDGEDVDLTVDDGESPDLDVGDGVLFETIDSHVGEVVGEPEQTGYNQWEVPIYLHDEGSYNTLYITEDSVEAEGQISDRLQADIQGEIQDFYDPDEWEPESDDDFEQLLEAGNRAWFKIARYISEHNKGKNKFKSINVGRNYAARSPMEVLTVVSEVLTGDADKSKIDMESLEKTYYEHPYLIDEWLDLFEPSEDAKEKLKEIGAWEDVS